MTPRPVQWTTVRAALAYDEERGVHVDLPTYFMVQGSWLPIEGPIHADGISPTDAGERVDVAAVIAKYAPTCLVQVPEYTPLDAAGQIDQEAIATLYPEARCADPAWVPPVLSAP